MPLSMGANRRHHRGRRRSDTRRWLRRPAQNFQVISMRNQHTPSLVRFHGTAALLCLAVAPLGAQPSDSCVCRGGKTIEAGAVSYRTNGERRRVVDMAKLYGDICGPITIEETAIFPRGTPESFYLE